MKIQDKAGFVLVHMPTMQAYPDLKMGCSWWIPQELGYGEPTIRVFETVEKARKAFHNWARGGLAKNISPADISRRELETYMRFLSRDFTPDGAIALWNEVNPPNDGQQVVRTWDIFHRRDFHFIKPVYVEKMQSEGWKREQRKEKAKDFKVLQVTMTCQNSFSIFKSQPTF